MASILEVIRTRRSIPQFTPDPVAREIIAELLDAAVWAPNHRLTEPWQFFVLEEESKRRFAEIRRDARRAALPNPDDPAVAAGLQKVYDDTVKTPVLIVVTASGHDDPELQEENYWATFAAVYAFMLGAWSKGIGTYFRTGKAIVESPVLREMLHLPEERRIMGVIYMGYPALVPQKRRTPAAEKTVWLD